MVAAQGDEPAAGVQLNKAIKHAARIGTAINVIAERDDLVIRLGRYELEQRVEGRQTAVNIADGQ